MNKNLTEIVFILDRSGSMSGLEADTIGGYNSFLAKQKKNDVNAYISTVLFDNDIKVVHDRVDIKNVAPLTEEDYFVGGCTALLDAVGGAIHHIGNVHKYAREEDRPSKTIFVIITDGMENASCRYSYRKVKDMIERQKARYDWEFIFMGANIDAEREAERFGIERTRAMNYRADKRGTRKNFRVMEDVVDYCMTPNANACVFEEKLAMAKIRVENEDME